MATTYDFIIVGSGPAGCALSARLANSPKAPNVLLLEAGRDCTDRSHRVAGQRFTTFNEKQMNTGYKTVPQEDCTKQELPYDRGRGLGGSSTINFGLYTVGAKDDYDQWAALVEDDDFSWRKMQPRLKCLETFHPEVPKGTPSKFVNARAEDHGSSGPLHVGFAREWEKDIYQMYAVFEDHGFPNNPDHNSGNPVGFSPVVNTVHNGQRTIAADLLTPKTDNLTIILDACVDRVLFDGRTAIGVEMRNNRPMRNMKIAQSDSLAGT